MKSKIYININFKSIYKFGKLKIKNIPIINSKEKHYLILV